MPFQCNRRPCKKDSSVRTASVMLSSKIELRKWAIASYLMATNLKGMSSHKLAREIGITQKSAWHMLHRIRESWNTSAPRFFGPVEVGETYVGGKEGNKHEWKKLNAGRRAVGKTAIIRIRDRDTNQIDAEVVVSTDAWTLTGFVHERTEPATMAFTDETRMYDRINRPHQTVKHSPKEYVNGAAHTNAIESFWATLKRAHYGVYHSFSVKHLPKYVNEFAGRHNIRPLDTIEQMSSVFLDGIGKRMRYTDLIDKVETRQPKMISYSDRQVF